MAQSGGTPRGGRGAWVAAAVVLTLAGVVVPYGVLGGGEPGLAVAGFWLLFGLAVVALIIVAVLPWKD